MNELGKWPSPEEMGLHQPEREKRTTTIVRPENPLLQPLDPDATYFRRFSELVTKYIDQNGGIPGPNPRLEKVKINNYEHSFYAISFPPHPMNGNIMDSLRGLIKLLYQVDQLQEGPIKKPRAKEGEKDAGIYITKDVEEFKKVNSDRIDGFLIRRKETAQGDYGELEIRHPLDWEGVSEMEFAFETVFASLILAGKVDLSTPEKMQETLPLGRRIFMDMYQELLTEMMPIAQRKNIHGLDEQIADIAINLYVPLIKNSGRAMNTMLVGAPGVGKSFVGGFFAGMDQVFTLPFKVEYLDRFDHYFAPRLARIKNAFGFPIVMLVDDVEALLESGISVDGSGNVSQHIDPQKRSKALSLLERMQDTYGLYLLCTLNHPDVEAAFLRRFNTIYFPLPTSDQRRFMLTKVIEQGPFTDDEFSGIIDRLEQETEGFNYSCLSLVPDYVANMKLALNREISKEEYEQTLEKAILKAKARTDSKGLARFDAAARRMVGHSS